MATASITRWFVGGVGSRIYRGARGITHGAQSLVGRLQTKEVAFAGVGGECSYYNAYVTLTRKNTAVWPLTITPIVDGVDQVPVTVDLNPVASVITETLEISLLQPYKIASVEQSRFAPRGARFKLRLELGQSGQTIYYSGEPRLLSAGKYAGGTHFSEFPVQGTLPTGLTYVKGGGSGLSVSLSTADDPTEGRYVKVIGNAGGVSAPFCVLIDSFDQLYGGVAGQEIELLCRAYVGNLAALASFPGPGVNLLDAGGTDPASGNVLASNYEGTDDLEMNLSALRPNAVPINLTQADYPDGEATGWVWHRYYQQWTGGTNWVRRIRSWHGALSAEPGTWQIDQAVSDANAKTQLGAIGLGEGGLHLAGHEGRIAFLSFSMDPGIEPPPVPDDVLTFAAPADEDPPNIWVDGFELEYDVEEESLEPPTEAS